MPVDAVYRAVITLPSVSGLPEDRSENVLAIGANGSVGASEPGNAAAQIAGFFTATTGAMTYSIGSHISSSVSRAANACTVSIYVSTDLSGATPFGSPIVVYPFTLPADDGSTPMPEEVSTVVSFHGDLTGVPAESGATRPAQRRRGRMYVGPLNFSTGTDASNVLRPSSAWRTNLGIAFKAMADGVNAEAHLFLGVWSKADADVRAALGGYVDDAWDSQRRRGLAATTRTTFGPIVP